MAIKRSALIAALLCCASWQARAQTGWTRLQQGTFDVYSQTDPAQAEPLVQSFIQLGSALEQVSPFRPSAHIRLKIIAFRSETEYSRYRLNAGSAAYYQQTHRGDYIVLPDLDARHRIVALHEFTHFLVAHSGYTLPLWLNEGLADFYSTFRVTDDTLTLGHPVPGRLAILHARTWLPLNKLFEVSTTSPYYSESESMKLFYSESWALAHMLCASPAYSGRFTLFLQMLSDGHDPAQAIQFIYNKTLTQVEEDLRSYANSSHLPLVSLRITPAEIARDASQPSPISNSEMDLNLADLALTDPNTRATVEDRLAAAASRSPRSSGPEEALGYLALRKGNLAEARNHFRTAADRNSSDANVLFYLAHLDHAAGAPPEQVIALLQRSLALNPDLTDARLELGLLEAEAGDYEAALAALQTVHSPRPENAYAAAYTEAYCYAYTDRLPEARNAAQYAQSLAASEQDRAEVAQLSEYISQQNQTVTNRP